MLALFAPWIVRGIAVLAVMAIIGGVYVHIEHKGYLKAEAEYKPKLMQCEAATKTAEDANAKLVVDVNNMRALIEKSQKSLAALEAREVEAIKAKNAALARLASREMEMNRRIEALTAIANGPRTPDKLEACNEADRILSDLAERVRQ